MSAPKPVARALHRIYKITLSPFVGRFCRFDPTCSDYTLEAIEKHGWCRGLLLGTKRIIRCNPYRSGGHDPVP